MQYIKQIQLETLSGTKTIELRLLDILQLNEVIDTLIISAASRDYFHMEGTMIKALKDRFNINVNELANKPEYDLRDSNQIWLSVDIKNKMIRRIACVERSSFYFEGSFRKAIKDVFGIIAMANIHGANIRKLAMPVLGTGAQQIPPDRVLPTLVDASKTALDQNSLLNKIIFFEKDSFKLEKLQYEFQSIIQEIKPEIIFNYNSRTVSIGGKRVLFTSMEYCYYLYFALNAGKNEQDEIFSKDKVRIDLQKRIVDLHKCIFPEMDGIRQELEINVSKNLAVPINTFRAYISKVNKRIRDSLLDIDLFKRYSIQKEGKRGSLQLRLNIPQKKIQIITP